MAAWMSVFVISNLFYSQYVLNSLQSNMKRMFVLKDVNEILKDPLFTSVSVKNLQKSKKKNKKNYRRIQNLK